MIPTFPQFKKIELADKEFIENFTKQFPPYCDFEFIDLWTYNPENTTTVSILNNNLVVKRVDITIGGYFYSFLGTNSTKDTIAKLLQKSEKEKIVSQLKLIPEINLKSSPDLQEYFSIREDLDNFDYIFSVAEMADLEGSKYSNKRNHINKFKRLYPNHTIQTVDLTNGKTKHDIKELFFLWEKQKRKNRKETIIELNALEKLFDLINVINIYCIGVYVNDRLIGFSTYHLAQDNYAMLSFIKGDTSYRAIYEYLNHEIAKHLKTLGSMYLNYEQDLGIPSLREAKTRNHPVFFLKKYIVGEKV